jgi:hypothetical protein
VSSLFSRGVSDEEKKRFMKMALGGFDGSVKGDENDDDDDDTKQRRSDHFYDGLLRFNKSDSFGRAWKRALLNAFERQTH